MQVFCFSYITMRPFSEEPFFHGRLGTLAACLGGLLILTTEDEVGDDGNPFDFIALHGVPSLLGTISQVVNFCFKSLF